MRMKFIPALLMIIFTTVAYAHEQGDWLIRAGAHYVDPKSDNNDTVQVESATMFTFDISYFLSQDWAIEVLAAAPFEHDIKLVGGSRAASTKHLPPTVSLQYHFNPNGTFQPYVGAGVNFTIFFDENTTGALAGTDLELDSLSVGLAAQAGFDVALSNDWYLNASLRYIQIETDGKVKNLPGNATLDLGSIEIDPWLFGLNLSKRF